MKAGISRNVITPGLGTPLGGSVRRTGAATEVADDLFVTVLFLETDEPLAIIAVDLLGFARVQTDHIKRAIGDRCGLEPRQVLLNNSHTHFGPMLHDVFYSDLKPSRPYITNVTRVIADTVAQAAARLSPATLSFGQGPTDIGISRWPGFRPSDEPIDREVFVLRVEAADFELIAFGTGCHPTVCALSNREISADFPGAACRALESGLQPADMAMFLQGAGGEVKARRNADPITGHFFDGTRETVQQVGQELAADVLEVIRRDMQPITGPIRSKLTTVPLPFDLPPDLKNHYRRLEKNQDVPPYYRDWATQQGGLLDQGRLQRHYNEVLHTLRFEGSDVLLLAYSDELCSGHALALKQALGDRSVAVLGYTNGLDIYIPTDRMLRAGGYEAVDSVYSTLSMPGPFASGIDDRLLAAAL